MTHGISHTDERAGLTLHNFTLRLGDQVLFALDLRVPPGGIATLMGPSGIGKSSLLSVIAGIQPPALSWHGDIAIDGENITGLPPQCRRIGLLRQDELLFPHLSVGANLAFAIPRDLRSRSARRALIADALNQADMRGFENRDPATLSGGQRARVGLLRALLSSPRVLLLDEPFSSLDAALRAQFREFIIAIASERKLPVLLVTHDQDDAAAMGGPIITLSNHTGHNHHA